MAQVALRGSPQLLHDSDLIPHPHHSRFEHARVDFRDVFRLSDQSAYDAMIRWNVV
jgi:hypothetical protein